MAPKRAFAASALWLCPCAGQIRPPRWRGTEAEGPVSSSYGVPRVSVAVSRGGQRGVQEVGLSCPSGRGGEKGEGTECCSLKARLCRSCSRLQRPLAPHRALGNHSILSLFQLGSNSGRCCQEKESCLGTLVTPRETLERERHLRRKPWGAGSPCLEELSGINLRCSHKFIARVRAGHCWSPFPACSGLVFSLCPSTQKLLKASGGDYPIYPQDP